MLAVGAACLTASGCGRDGPASPADPPQDAELFASMRIPEFEAMDQDGAPRDRAIFNNREANLARGLPPRYTILTFAFTRCVTICPITTGQMIRVQQAIKDLPGGTDPTTRRFQLVSFSVDPIRDTPEAMRRHAEGFADFSVWTFLTTDQATVERVVQKGLGFALEPERGSKIDLGGGQSMENIIHPSKLLLVAPSGEVIGMYSGLDDPDVDRLITRLGRINRER